MIWRTPGTTYKAAYVWNEIGHKQAKVDWHRLIWFQFHHTNKKPLGNWHEQLILAKKKLKGMALITVVLRLVWSAFIYHLWQERNKRFHGGSDSTVENLFSSIAGIVGARLAGIKKLQETPVMSVCM
ncbi:hypothetical protein REPUB_Repub07fG0142100 [Reevesia pubescens]